MIFRQPSQGASKIGRNFQFNDPLKHSNKKHYWNGGLANYGLLTTQQIEMLNQMKQRQKQAHLHDIKPVQKSLNYSVKQLKYKNLHKQQPHHDKHQAFNIQNHTINHQSNDKQQQILKTAPRSKRSISEYRTYEDLEPCIDKFTTIDLQQTPVPFSRIKKEACEQKRMESGIRRVKTIGVEELRNQPNLQEKNRIEEIFNGIIDTNKTKFQNRHFRIESGNIKVYHSPQSVKKTSNPIEKNQFLASLEPQIYSDRSNIEIQQRQQTQLFERSKANVPQQMEKVDRKMLKMDHKKATRLKFKRDHSPTFCNSIDYPLKYFRHV